MQLLTSPMGPLFYLYTVYATPMSPVSETYIYKATIFQTTITNVYVTLLVGQQEG